MARSSEINTPWGMEEDGGRGAGAGLRWASESSQRSVVNSGCTLVDAMKASLKSAERMYTNGSTWFRV